MRINFLNISFLLLLVANECLFSSIGDMFSKGVDKLKNKTNRLINKFSSHNDDVHHHSENLHNNDADHHGEDHHHHRDRHHRDRHHHHHHDHNSEHRKSFSPLKFLEANGYTLGKKSREKFVSSPLVKGALSSLSKNVTNNEDLKDMVKLFQRLYHLNVTGDLDNKTVTQMLAPRCGFPDLPPTESNPNALASFKAFQVKWDKKDLKYKFIKYNAELGERETRIAISKAFKYWSEQSNLNFEEVCMSCPADLVIDFNEADHKDGNPFDGESGVLAHAYFPKDGRIHFDESEVFTEDTTKGVNLRIVAAHEIGHALGLEHSFVKGALMYPYYAGYIPDFKLPEDDIMGIQMLYGKRSAPSTPATTTTGKTSNRPTITTKKIITTHTTTMTGITNNPKNLIACTATYEAVFTSPKNNIWVLTDHDDLWLYNVTGRVWNRFSLYEVYPKIEGAVRGGVKCLRNYTWFFKGKKVWAYENYNLVSGYPKLIKDPLFPSNPWTAVNKDGTIYVLKGSLAYEFDTVNLTVVGNLPIYLKKKFPGLPDWVESAVKYNEQHYMFKDKWVYKFNPETNKILDGFPKIKFDSWFPCYRSSSPSAFSVADTRKKL